MVDLKSEVLHEHCFEQADAFDVDSEDSIL